jgi:flagellar hook-associated protein 2
MAGNITSLGIGSGVLTADIIDKLKEADKSAIVTPLDTKIDLNKQKQEAYSLLSSFMTTLKGSASALSDDTIFAGKKVDVSGDAIVTVDAGTNVESFSLETTKLAQKHISQFSPVAAKDTQGVTGGNGTLTISGVEIEYTSSMTLQDLAQAITDAGGDKFSASILKTGEGAFNLIVSSKETGAANALTISDSVGGSLATTLMDPANDYDADLQEAQDAEFIYNGISMTRASNTIDDIAVGLNITLKKEGDVANVDISFETQNIVDEVQNFVDAYNELISNISDMTLANAETGQEGVFNNDSFVKSISRELGSMLSSMNIGGQTLTGLGAETTNLAGEPEMLYIFDVDQNGKLSVNTANLEKKLNDDPEGMKELFSGAYDEDYNPTNGFFDLINNKLEEYTGSGKLLSNYETSLETEAKNLAQSRTSALESLNVRYDTMAARFAAYDAIISKINSQFASLQMMIDSENK